MKGLLQPVESRVWEVTVGVLLGIGGLFFCVIGITSIVDSFRGSNTRSETLVFASIMLAIGGPATLYAGRLLFPRLRGRHGGIIGPLGLEITGVFLMIYPLVLFITREWGHLLLQLAHVGSATACFALTTENWTNRSECLSSLGERYGLGSKFFTSAPNRVGYSEASKRAIGATPLLPWRRESHVSPTVWPTGEITPSPVTTTRRRFSTLTRF